MAHIHHIGSDRQGSEFVVNTRFILNQMQSQFVYGEDDRAELNFKALEPRKTGSKAEDEDARRDED